MLHVAIFAAFALAAGFVFAQTALPDSEQCYITCTTQLSIVADL
jgi:hypothetical protein